MSLKENQMLFTSLISVFILKLNNYGYRVTFGEAHRTQYMQDYYLKKGLTKVNYSKHQDRLAIELYIFKNGKLLVGKDELKLIGLIWSSLHVQCVWGGDWNRNRKIEDEKFLDLNHFELKQV